MTVSEDLIERWEAAYRRYTDASKISAMSFAADQDVAREMVMASHEVASAWRAMESTPDLPWWVMAALAAAAQAFEYQVKEWSVPRPTPHRRNRTTNSH